MSQPERFKITKSKEQELEEQAYRLRVFLEIVAEADMLLLKKLMKKRAQEQAEEEKP